MSVVDDMLAECEALYNFVAARDEIDWRKPTVFWNWTTYDEIVHNHFLDLLAMMSIREPARFAETVTENRRRSEANPDYGFRMFTNDMLGMLSRQEALKRWRDGYLDMADLFGSRRLDERMTWFGPPMSIESCALARQMETWAHGQDIYDLFDVRRENADRLRNIALLGVKTFGWSFLNRKLRPPEEKPYVSLTAPSGVLWQFNAPDAKDRVEGPAEDFCLVVTQRRHVDDTRLRVIGARARAWLEIAQCFAGDPADGPAPGARVVAFTDGARF